MAQSTGLLSRLTGGNKVDVDALQAKITEASTAIAHAREVAAKLRLERATKLQEWLAGKNDKLAKENGDAIVAADDTVSTLERKREDLVGQLHQATVVREEQELNDKWDKARELLKARSAAVAELQSLLDKVGAALDKVVASTVAVTESLPEKQLHKPLTYTNDIYPRVNSYLFGKTKGQLGRSGSTVHMSATLPTLVEMDAEARKFLLVPLEQRLAAK